MSCLLVGTGVEKLHVYAGSNLPSGFPISNYQIIVIVRIASSRGAIRAIESYPCLSLVEFSRVNDVLFAVKQSILHVFSVLPRL